jgi:hypothetical protein
LSLFEPVCVLSAPRSAVKFTDEFNEMVAAKVDFGKPGLEIDGDS